MKAHKKNCNFIEAINEAKKENWKADDGECSGFLSISETQIHFNNGWDSFPSIDFNYCPICGAKLINN